VYSATEILCAQCSLFGCSQATLVRWRDQWRQILRWISWCREIQG